MGKRPLPTSGPRRANCGTATGSTPSTTAPRPRLVRVQDPFGRLFAKSKGSVLVRPRQVAEAAEGG